MVWTEQFLRISNVDGWHSRLDDPIKLVSLCRAEAL